MTVRQVAGVGVAATRRARVPRLQGRLSMISSAGLQNGVALATPSSRDLDVLGDPFRAEREKTEWRQGAGRGAAGARRFARGSRIWKAELRPLFVFLGPDEGR